MTEQTKPTVSGISIDPYYGQRIEVDDHHVPYILQLNAPLSRPQMELLLRLCSELKEQPEHREMDGAQHYYVRW